MNALRVVVAGNFDTAGAVVIKSLNLAVVDPEDRRINTWLISITKTSEEKTMLYNCGFPWVSYKLYLQSNENHLEYPAWLSSNH